MFEWPDNKLRHMYKTAQKEIQNKSISSEVYEDIVTCLLYVLNDRYGPRQTELITGIPQIISDIELMSYEPF